MQLKTVWYSAIEQRTSRRSYKNQKPDRQKLEQVRHLIDTVNQESGLQVQFVENGETFLSGFKASYGLFSGKPSVIVLTGKKSDPELKQKCGYYGEFILLECVALGLGTCWIGGTYSKEACRNTITINDQEEIVCIIAAGIVYQNKTMKELLLSQFGKGKQTFDELLVEKDCAPPLWVSNGIEAARTAPSAVNGKPIAYQFLNNQLTASIAKKNHGSEEIDLGISMAHFQLGAQQGLKEGTWVKDGASYRFV